MTQTVFTEIQLTIQESWSVPDGKSSPDKSREISHPRRDFILEHSRRGTETASFDNWAGMIGSVTLASRYRCSSGVEKRLARSRTESPSAVPSFTAAPLSTRYLRPFEGIFFMGKPTEGRHRTRLWFSTRLSERAAQSSLTLVVFAIPVRSTSLAGSAPVNSHAPGIVTECRKANTSVRSVSVFPSIEAIIQAMVASGPPRSRGFLRLIF